MASPSSFSRVVTVVFVLNVLVKAALALAGVFAFGEATEEIVTANLPVVPRTVVSALVVANTIFSFPLPLVPVFRWLRRAQGGAAEPSARYQAVQRTAVVLGIGAVAVALPSFSLAMGFMGSLTLPFLTFIFPALFYYRLHGRRSGLAMKATLLFVVVAGAVGLVAGLAANVAIAIGHH